MKKYLFIATLCTMLFSACSKDEMPNPNDGAARNVEITMDFTVSSGVEVRAGRPLYSQEALQQVNDLKLYIFKDGFYEKSIDITEFNNQTAQGTESHTYKFTEKLTDGSYQFLAVGLEENQAYKALAFSAGTTKIEDAVLELNQAQEAAEVFAGVDQKSYTVSATAGSITASIKLTRVVAGVLGYFKNIPYEVAKDGKMERVMKVCVELSGKGTKANLKDNTTNTAESNNYKMLTIDLTGEQKADDGNYYKKEAHTGAYTTVPNSFLVGGYVLPFNKTVGTQTFKVVLYGDSDAVLKSYKVKVKDQTDTEIDVLANHFYGMGQKKTNTGGTEPGPGTPETDKDNPVDLSKDQVITITVDAQWGTIHDLELGDEIL